MPKVTIGIVTRGKPEYLKPAIMSMLRNSNPDLYEILILDNGSTPMLELNHPKVKVYNAPENLGFGRGFNLLIKEALNKDPNTHFIVMNDDVEVHPGWLDALIKGIEDVPQAGVLGTVCYYPDGTVQHAGAFLTSYFTGQHFQDIPATYQEFEYLGFVCVLLTNKLIKTMLKNQQNVFDEKIAIAYSEDVDVCYAARKYGFTCILVPGSRMLHHEATTMKKGLMGTRQEVMDLQTRNKEYVAKKWEDVDYTDYSKKYKATFVSRLSGEMSYQQVLKNLATSMDKDPDVDVSLLSEETIYAPEPTPREWKLRKLCMKKIDPSRICIRYGEGEYGYLAYNRDIIYTTLENWGDKIPYKWKENINLFKQCWVTSTEVKKTFERSGITVPIKVIPHGLDYSLWNESAPKYFNNHLPPFLFLVNDMYGTRKNMNEIVCAFIEVFRDNKEVGLYIQSSQLSRQLAQFGFAQNIQGGISQRDWKKEVINRWLTSLGWDGKSQIFAYDDWIDTKTLVSIYSRSSAVIATGNEGWGFIGQSALAMKKPLIYLDIGGMKDYVNEDTGMPVKVGRLEPSRQFWLCRQYLGGLWGVPDFEDLKRQMLNVYQNYDAAKKKAILGQEIISKDFTWEKAAEKAKSAIVELVEAKQ